MVRFSYEVWAVGRLQEQVRCRVEGSMICIPLRGDPICRACYEDATGLRGPSAAGKGAATPSHGGCLRGEGAL